MSWVYEGSHMACVGTTVSGILVWPKDLFLKCVYLLPSCLPRKSVQFSLLLGDMRCPLPSQAVLWVCAPSCSEF